MAAEEHLSSFLHYGYVPRPEQTLIDHVRTSLAAHPHTGDAQDDELIRSGAKALRSGFDSLETGLHVVPLSGGLDSRAILASLLAAGIRDDLVAVTIGTPGTFDFDIAQRVASVAKVRHERIDLRSIDLDEQMLERALLDSKAASWVFDVFFHRLIPIRFGPDATYWSGFMGGELAGSHVTPNPSVSWPAALGAFAAHEAYCRGRSVAPASFDPVSELPLRPWCDPSLLAYGDQLDFGVRQAYIRRVVVVEGFKYREPFLAREWVRFILGVPTEHRHDERLYKRILLEEFPELFSLPSKNSAGLSLTAHQARVTARIRWLKIREIVRTRPPMKNRAAWRSPMPFPMLNYLDFASALRSRPHIRELVHGLVRALHERGAVPWIDGTEVWTSQERDGFTFDGACILTLLASLELNLRADGSRPKPFFEAPR